MEENVYYVYRHTSKSTNAVFYVGRSKVSEFKRAHIKAPSVRSKEWFEEYLNTGIIVEVVAKNLTCEMSGELEEFLVSLYGRRDLGTGNLVNKSNGGLYNKGMIRSEASKKNLSDKRKGVFKGELNPYYGKKHSDEVRSKMKKPHVNNTGSNHFRSKIVIHLLTGVFYSSLISASK